MKGKMRSNLLIALGAVMILGAAMLTGFNLISSHKAGQTASEALAVLQVEIPKPQNTSAQTPASPGAIAGVQLTMDDFEIPDHVLNPKMDMPVKQVNGINYIGYIEIPALNLELPIIAEETASNLKLAPCRYAGSAYQDNLVIAGHNYIQHFGYLNKLSYGDVIRIVDMDGNVFRYEVADLEVIPADGVADMLGGDWDLTLFTCNVSKSARITIRCVRTDK